MANRKTDEELITSIAKMDKMDAVAKVKHNIAAIGSKEAESKQISDILDSAEELNLRLRQLGFSVNDYTKLQRLMVKALLVSAGKVDVACGIAGIPLATHKRWMRDKQSAYTITVEEITSKFLYKVYGRLQEEFNKKDVDFRLYKYVLDNLGSELGFGNQTKVDNRSVHIHNHKGGASLGFTDNGSPISDEIPLEDQMEVVKLVQDLESGEIDEEQYFHRKSAIIENAKETAKKNR